MISCRSSAFCDKTTTVYGYVGHDNPITLALLADGTAVPGECGPGKLRLGLTGVTRVVMTFGADTIDSSTAPAGTFDWTTQDDSGLDVLIVRPGRALTGPEHVRTETIGITLYSTSWPNGYAALDPAATPALALRMI